MNLERVVRYHLSELEIIQTPGHPKRSVPTFDCRGKVVLDIGCGIGQTLLAHEFKDAAALHGIDPDHNAIEYGAATYPNLKLTCAPAESLPYPAAHFDVIFSRVSIPYTRINVAIAEMYRVAKPGAHVWMTLHGTAMEWFQTKRVIRERKWKDLVKRSYIWANGAWFAITGKTFHRPGSAVMESFQFEFAFRRALRRAGFSSIESSHNGTQFVIRATKPEKGKLS